MTTHPATCTAFEGMRRIASGSPKEVAGAVKRAHDRAGAGAAPILVFDDATSRPVEFDLRGSVDDVLARLAHDGANAPANAGSGVTGAAEAERGVTGTADAERGVTGSTADVDSGAADTADAADVAPARGRGRGRPKLGVVAREVTLLPRHWEWLNAQPGGASVVLRKLVESARLVGSDKERMRQAQEAADRFMTAIGGNLPDYEEATRALYANDRTRFESMTDGWPGDVREHARKLAAAAFCEPN